MARRLRDTNAGAWLIPLIYAASGLALGVILPRLRVSLTPYFDSTVGVSAAIGIYSSIASGMITLTAIVFSLAFLTVQFSATAYTPRIVPWIARDPVMSHSFGVFTATFMYALTALAWVDRSGSGRVPWSILVAMVILLILSIIMFISLIQRVGMLQISRMLVFIGDKGRDVIEGLYPPIQIAATPALADLSGASRTQTLLHYGYPRIVQRISISDLVELAGRAGCVIEVVAVVGDAVMDSTAILRILGGNASLPEKSLRDAIHLGEERSFEQDPKYAIRLLVDIAIRALSPAVNDPTTAVQALDQIEDLLIRLGRRRLEFGAFHDEQCNLRLLIPYPTWEDFLLLSFNEIRSYGATSIQVMRRMKALVNEMLSVLPEERKPALSKWQARLQHTVERSFLDADDKLEASTEDRQGLGRSLQHIEIK